MLWHQWALIAAIIIGIVTYMLVARPVWVSDFGRGVAAVAAILLFVTWVWPMVTNVTPTIPAASQSASLTDAMKAEIKQQLDEANKALADKVSALETSVKAVSEKDIEQDARLAKIEGRLDTLETKMTAAEAEIKALEARTKSIEDGDVTITGSPTDLTDEQASQALADAIVAQGWQPDQIKVLKIDWSKNPYDNGREVFVDRQIRAQQDLVRVLSDPQNAAERAMRKHILNSLKGMPESERERALSGQGFVPVQFLDEACFSGNTFYAGGKAHREGDVCKKAGDVWWIYVDSTGVVRWDTAIRADCGNPGLLEPPRPKHPKPSPTPNPTESTKTPKPSPSSSESKTPTPTPTEPTKTPTPTPTKPTETCPPDKPHGTWPVCKDDPAKDPAAQDKVPEQVKGTAPAVTEPASKPSVTRPAETATYTPPAQPEATKTPRETEAPKAEEPVKASPTASGTVADG